jgi:hypothetical protein
LPAVQAARESARKLQCANNLKQLSLVVASYTATNGCLPPGSTDKWNGDYSFPSGWSDPSVGSSTPWGHFGWSAVILPQLEQQNGTGHFKLNYSPEQDGAVVGKHKVSVQFKPATVQAEVEMIAGRLSRPPELNDILTKYGSLETTTKTVEITPETHEIELTLD